MFNSPNTAAMMGTVPPHRRGVAAGRAHAAAETPARLLSIAFVLAIVTSAVPKATLFAVFFGARPGTVRRQAGAVHRETCTSPLWVLAAVSLAGVGVCLARPRHANPPATSGQDAARAAARDGHAAVTAMGGRAAQSPPPPPPSPELEARRHRARVREPAPSADGRAPRRDHAAPRSRYYEETGLLSEAARAARRASTASLPAPRVERLREVMRLKELLGVTLEGAQDAAQRRGGARAEVARAASPRRLSTRRGRRELLTEALGHIDRQPRAWCATAPEELVRLERELTDNPQGGARRKIREARRARRRRLPARRAGGPRPRTRA